MPSTLTVLNDFDKGAGSLREAIVHAHDGDSIVFDPGLAGRTITLTSGDLDINKSLDIAGPGAGLLAISGNDTSRIFDIGAGHAVAIVGLTITHGRASGTTGAGILNVGSALTLGNVVVSYNTAFGHSGGAISNRNGAVLTVSDSTSVGNQIMGKADGSLAGGGAIFIDDGATATVNHSTFIRNRAVGGDGGVVSTGTGFHVIGGAEGGAIHNDGHCTITGSSFTANEAVGGIGGRADKSFSFYAIGFAAGGVVFNHPSLDAVLLGRRYGTAG